MRAIGFPGAFASAAKIASRCRWEDADDPVVADRQGKLDRWHAARRNGLSADMDRFRADMSKNESAFERLWTDMAQRENNRMQ